MADARQPTSRENDVGREEITALIAVLQDQLASGGGGKAVGTWRIGYNKQLGAFIFDHCENEGYCEERPAVIAINGDVLDPGGPLFD